MHTKSFVERFLERLDKIDPSEIESFVRRTARERDFFAHVLETLLEGVVVVDERYCVTLVNPAARRILRWPTRQRLVGEPLVDLLEAGPLRDLVESFIEAPRPIHNEEILLSHPSRNVYNLHLLPVLMEADDESVGGAAMVLQDLTESHERQRRNAQAEKIASLATLTAGVAHEIKNPLNSLSIHAQLLERAAAEYATGTATGRVRESERIVRSCEVIQEEVERLRNCVDDFIDAARPRRLQFSQQNLNHIVEAVLKMASLEFEERGIRIETDLESDLPLLPIDEKQMQQALRNILRNAMEAIDTARRPMENRAITLHTFCTDEAVTLEISDNGCGIAESELPKIFEPYYTTKFNGSGLGLMAVGRIIREHGGRVTVTSSDGEGCTFSIDLPILNPRIRLLEGK